MFPLAIYDKYGCHDDFHEDVKRHNFGQLILIFSQRRWNLPNNFIWTMGGQFKWSVAVIVTGISKLSKTRNDIVMTSIQCPLHIHFTSRVEGKVRCLQRHHPFSNRLSVTNTCIDSYDWNLSSSPFFWLFNSCILIDWRSMYRCKMSGFILGKFSFYNQITFLIIMHLL